MDSVCRTRPMETYTAETSKIISEKELEYISTSALEKNTMDNGKTTPRKVTVSSFMRMEIGMRENGKMTKSKEEGSSSIPMGPSMKETLKMIWSMAQE